MKVLVTGASGQTGSIVVRKLLEGGQFEVRALVRSPDSEAKLRKIVGDTLVVKLEVVCGEIASKECLQNACKDCDAVIIVTSAMPQIRKRSLLKVIGLKLITFGLSSAKPSFRFPENQSPEHVDWVGQRNQIDAAKEAKVKHVVVISSMAGTDPNHFLNTNMENIVLWKRKAEKYLIESGLTYTIIHPGALLPWPRARAPAPGGKRQLFVSVDDLLIREAERLKTIAEIPREDVAEVAVLCLTESTVQNRSFDLAAGAEGKGQIFKGDLKELLGTLEGKNCSYDSPQLPDSSL